jgi:hypothetical protein
MGLMHHSRYDLDWSVFHPNELHTYPNKMRAGLQLADCAASAIFAGLEPTPDGRVRPEFAKALIPKALLADSWGIERSRYRGGRGEVERFGVL